MQIFVTGATGFLGYTFLGDQSYSRNSILALARSDHAAACIGETSTCRAHRGDLRDTDSLVAGVRASHAVVHLAWSQSGPTLAADAEIDRRALEAMGAALEGTGKPFIVLTSTVRLPLGRLATEDDVVDPASTQDVRGPAEEAALALADRSVRVAVVRCPPAVHGPPFPHHQLRRPGLIPSLIALAREKGASVFIGDGQNRLPAVHRVDAAALLGQMLDGTFSPGTRYHMVGDESVRFRDLAAVIGRRLRVPVVSRTSEEAAAHFGALSPQVTADNPVSNTQTLRESRGWRVTSPSLLEDLELPHYFALDNAALSSPDPQPRKKLELG